MSTYTVDTSDICELAHELTVIECERLGIEVDMKVDENGDETERYTEKAQDIFNKYYDLVESKLIGTELNTLQEKDYRTIITILFRVLDECKNSPMYNGEEEPEDIEQAIKALRANGTTK